MEDVVYLDNAASTPLRPETVSALSASAAFYANPSSIHALGQDVRKRIETARASVAALLGADASEVVFTSGATEANNLALRGVIEPLMDAGKKSHVVTTALEHASVLKTFEALAARGLETTIVPPGADGVVRAEDVLAAVRPETALVSVIAVSNELGSRQPIEAIGAALSSHPARPLFHVDAVQAVVSTDFAMSATHVDLLTVSAHKIGGPKGIGALVVRKGLQLKPLLTGGGHERGTRSGTENVSGILGFGAATEALRKARPEEIERYQALRARFLNALPSGALLLVPKDAPHAPHILTIECPGKENDWIVLLLSRAGVMAAAGSACKSGSREASAVIKALGLSEARAKSVVRFSFGWSTNEKDVDRAIDALHDALAR
ncbi:MAG: cysteine desulfurase family protein [Patescibacteria group bacterium]|nr:MAG: cysteine desulfurase family protein [Patescibacteria group bacterium]